MEGTPMAQPKEAETTARNVQEECTVEVDSVSPNGRISYSLRSILENPTTRRHFLMLRSKQALLTKSDEPADPSLRRQWLEFYTAIIERVARESLLHGSLKAPRQEE